MNQTTIFDMLYPKYKITKPIRLIELFAGYGSQALALKYLGVNFEHWKTCEWAIKSIQAYKDIHFTNDTKEISMSKDEMIDYLYNRGISSNYNEPMTKEQIKRLNEKQLKTIIENIEITHNLVNIQQVKGKDLEIVDTDKYEYILTYSFPCQDLSLAGKGKGMADTSTRSGMLWEVERILNELKELNQLPQILLMENVPQVHGTDNVEHFNKWQLALENMGYKSYFQDLIATDYGIPQTRNRCFMVSILGDYSYTFPKPIPLKLKLKDLLEDNVDEKYYLSDKMLQYITSKDDKYKVNENKLIINRDIACSKTTIEDNIRADTTDYICDELPENTNLLHLKEPMILDDRDIGLNGINITDVCPTQRATRNGLKVLEPLKIKNDTKKGYLEATDGDEIDISSRMEHHRGTVQKDKIQTLTTSGGNDREVCVGTYQYSKSDKFMQGRERLQLGKEVSDTLQTTPKEGVVINPLKGISGKIETYDGDGIYVQKDMIKNINKYAKHQQDLIQCSNGLCRTIPAGTHGSTPHLLKTVIDYQPLRIRKLTPRECGRLMNVKDEDITKMLKNQSDSSAYHCFGDSICTNCLMAIFGELLDINWKQKLEEMLYGNTN